jgi:hypothetical protein
MSIEEEMLDAEARRRGLSVTQLRMLRATPDRLMADLAADARRSRAPSSIIPAKPNAEARPPVGSNGWAAERPLQPPAGVAIADRLMDAQDALDRRQRERDRRP